jgi:Domain of unknown function (DUF4386)
MMTSPASRGAEPSMRQAALVAGLAMLAMAALAPVANFGILGKLVVPGDAKATTDNVLASEGAFRFALYALLAVTILDVVVAWAFYVLMEPVSQAVSLLAAWLRIAYTATFAASLAELAKVLVLLDGEPSRKAFGAEQLQAQVALLLDAFRSQWTVSLGIFGVHLLVLGALMLRSGYVPRLVGVLVLAAGSGYSADTFAHLLLPHQSAAISKVTLWLFFGEMSLIVWPLWRGIRGFNEKVGRRDPERRPT